MGEITGSVFEMNAHMVKTHSAVVFMLIGGFLTLLFLGSAVKSWIDGGWKPSLVFLILGLVSAAIFFVGVREPRVKEIKACAVGPVSLEQVAIVYDIVEIDGKELTLRER